ncbi:hypothetical protein ACE02P_16265 [Shewanella bicestrii]|uniref:Uncharacterized protein n=1 Tax=Shewanella sp. (strain MR-7) TaxID=60481 RepID=Q0HZ75_SHESR
MKIKHTIVALASFAFMGSVNASVTYDEAGVGFVGKGDIQSLFDWNNSQLQDNAKFLHFQFIATGTVTWRCKKAHANENADGEGLYVTMSSQTTMLGANASVEARKNAPAKITGFYLNGIDGSLSGETLGDQDCSTVGKVTPSGKKVENAVEYVYVENSAKFEGLESPLLQVSFSPSDEIGAEWFDLPVTE